MKLKSVSMIEDRTGRRYAYPAVVAEIHRFSTLDDAIRALRANGYSLKRKEGGRAIMKQHNEYRYICAL